MILESFSVNVECHSCTSSLNSEQSHCCVMQVLLRLSSLIDEEAWWCSVMNLAGRLRWCSDSCIDQLLVKHLKIVPQGDGVDQFVPYCCDFSLCC